MLNLSCSNFYTALYIYIQGVNFILVRTIVLWKYNLSRVVQTIWYSNFQEFKWIVEILHYKLYVTEYKWHSIVTDNTEMSVLYWYLYFGGDQIR